MQIATRIQIVDRIASHAPKTIRPLQLGMSWFPEQAGGLDRYYFDLLNALGGMGSEIHGLVVGSAAVEENSDGRVRAFARAEDSLIRRWRAARAAMETELREFEPELVVSHFALYAAPVLGKIRGRAHVVHFHGPWALECREEGDRGIGNWVKRQIERRVYRSADFCIVLSEAFGRLLAKEYSVSPERIRVIPGGVNIERFRPRGSRAQAREKLGWPMDRRIVFCVRRLARRMGIENLIAAAKDIRRKHPDALFLIAGKGRLREELEKQISDAGLENWVRLLGFASEEELPLMYRAADITVVPSSALEGFGLTVVESLAAGTPCLVSPVGGLPEVVCNLEPALVFAGANSEAFVERIDAALSGALPLPSAERCVAFAAERYDWNIIAARVAAVYREAVEAHGKMD